MEITWEEQNVNETNGEGIASNTSRNIVIEKPYSTNAHPVNGKHAPEDEDEEEAEEDDLILGDEAELAGDEEEFEVELDEDIDADDLDEDDLVIDTEEDTEEDDDL